jgi:nucleoside-diphosphate-sugar epimerase
VAILGARGFIARALASRLARRGVPTLPISSARIDLASPAAGRSLAALLDPADVVVMTAALTPDKGQDAGTLMRNLAMGEAVAQAIAARPGAQLVYLSSDAVYDWRQPLISEQVAPSPTSLYSSMHLTREQVLTAAAAAARVPCCLLRPCAVYGPGDTHQGYGPNRFVRTALADGVIELFGEGEEQRDHVYIEDVAAAIEAAILHRSEGTLNVVSGRSVSFAEVARSVAALAARPVAIRHRDRRGPVTHRHFDPTALWRAFPDFRPTDLAAGLRLAVSAP